MVSFDLYYLLIENVFGGALIGILGLALCLFLIGLVSKMSPFIVYTMIAIFLTTMFMGFNGGLAVFLILIVSITYATIYFLKFLRWM
jgi:hypothetical protein